MTDTTLLSDRPFVAVKALKARATSLFKWFKPKPKGLHIRQINPHLARDIGLTPADQERFQHRLPSQTHHHPRR